MEPRDFVRGPSGVSVDSLSFNGEDEVQTTRGKRKGRRYEIALHPTVHFNSTNGKVLAAIRAQLGEGTMIVARQRPGHRELNVLHVTGTANVSRLIECLKPSLVIRSAQADISVECRESRLQRLSSTVRQYSASELELYSSLIQANRKGGKATANSRESDESRESKKSNAQVTG